MKTKPRIGNLRDASGLIVSEGNAKAGLLNKYFSSMFTSEVQEYIPTLASQTTPSELPDVNISPSAVKMKLKTLNVTGATGPDDLNPRLLQEAHHSLCVPLAHLYRKSLDTGSLPRNWTLAQVVPIHKKGDRQDPGNYRPVSLTAVPCNDL